MLKNEVMMTSLMINLDSHADFFNEIPEYSEYMVKEVVKYNQNRPMVHREGPPSTSSANGSADPNRLQPPRQRQNNHTNNVRVCESKDEHVLKGMLEPQVGYFIKSCTANENLLTPKKNVYKEFITNFLAQSIPFDLLANLYKDLRGPWRPHVSTYSVPYV